MAGNGGVLHLFSFAGSEAHLREVSEAFASLLGLTSGELSGRSVLEFVHLDDRHALSDALAMRTCNACEVTVGCRFVQADGRHIYLQWAVRPLPGKDVWQAASIESDDLVDLLAERRGLRTRLDLAIGQATAAMWDFNILEDRIGWEPQAAEILGFAPEHLPNSPAELAAAVIPADSHIVHEALDRLLAEGQTEVGLRIGQDSEIRHLSLRSRILDRDASGRPLRAVGLLIDITTAKAMEEQLLRMSVSDALTGIPNRRAFDHALRGEWRRCTRAREALSIIMVDIDCFKQFNDSFGHPVGDQALITVARALAANPRREGDLVARYGGEEFAIILPGTDAAGAHRVGHQLVEAVRALTVRQAPGWNLSVSVGTASWHPDRELINPSELHRRADEALYAAKAAGKDRSVVYEDSLAAQHTLQIAIAKGIEQHEFELYYQPLIDLARNNVTGFEALIRWNRPGHGRVSPDDFIPLAETTTLICELGRWTIREATRQLALWADESDVASTLRVAVNISARHAASLTLVTDVEEALAAAAISAHQLEVEITETALRDSLLDHTALARLRSLGVSVAIDDFGTGYTSIGELAHLPADVVKIDGSFTASPDPRTQDLVKLMIDAAHTFDLRVVAEGIESESTLQTLRTLKCDAGQGYLLARPMPANRVIPWLSAWRARTSPLSTR
ncbi:putative bifunctional diguanylate cyclase/phosphodiesterase [Gaiella sp.]|uniref:putative bifunctional diguanylate cyclase/phosphodiesterase n=1 Tax=Gaiella sp. TaxID=2663207 RepID=UPI003983C634